MKKYLSALKRYQLAKAQSNSLEQLLHIQHQMIYDDLTESEKISVDEKSAEIAVAALDKAIKKYFKGE